MFLYLPSYFLIIYLKNCRRPENKQKSVFICYWKTKDDIEFWISPINLSQKKYMKNALIFFVFLLIVEFFENMEISPPYRYLLPSIQDTFVSAKSIFRF